MATITITLSDLPNSHVRVVTDADRPAVGRSVTPAQSLAMELLGTAFRREAEVVYDANQVPLLALALDLLHVEQLGWAATPEIRDRARRALGRSTFERPQADGVDIDRIHRTRGLLSPEMKDAIVRVPSKDLQLDGENAL